MSKNLESLEDLVKRKSVKSKRNEKRRDGAVRGLEERKPSGGLGDQKRDQKRDKHTKGTLFSRKIRAHSLSVVDKTVIINGFKICHRSKTCYLLCDLLPIFT